MTMTKRNWALTAAAVTLMTIGLTVTPGWSASRQDQLTFNGAVSLPGVRLPAGTYVFEVMVPGGPRQVVRVSGRDGHHYFMGFTETIERARDGRTRPMVTFGEAPAGTPPPISTWYPIGSSQAHRFLYPEAAR
jgi:hypothetical protein